MIKTDLKLIQDMKEEGKISKSELLDFAIRVLEDEIMSQTYKEHDKVQKGIKFLKEHNLWSSLLRIAKDCLQDCLEVVQGDEMLRKNNICNIIEFKKDIVKMGKGEFMDLLSDKAKEKYFGKEKR
jgi:hypothetical protein